MPRLTQFELTIIERYLEDRFEEVSRSDEPFSARHSDVLWTELNLVKAIAAETVA